MLHLIGSERMMPGYALSFRARKGHAWYSRTAEPQQQITLRHIALGFGGRSDWLALVEEREGALRLAELGLQRYVSFERPTKWADDGAPDEISSRLVDHTKPNENAALGITTSDAKMRRPPSKGRRDRKASGGIGRRRVWSSSIVACNA